MAYSLVGLAIATARPTRAARACAIRLYHSTLARSCHGRVLSVPLYGPRRSSSLILSGSWRLGYLREREGEC
jgi:hypothetical protein